MGRLRRVVDVVRASLFVLPAVAMVVSFAAARLLVGVDGVAWAGESTVDSARAVLAAVIGATVAFASIAFSISLLVTQQASAQFSPRVVATLTRDPFHQRVVALVMATLTFSLVTLQRVRGPLSDEGTQSVPHLSVAVALLLGLVSILAVVGAIHHTASEMDLSRVLARVVEESRRHPRRPDVATARPIDGSPALSPTLGSTPLVADRDGWVQAVDIDRLADAVPSGHLLHLEAATGRYVWAGSVLGRVQPPLPPDEVDRRAGGLRAAVVVGPSRTPAADPAYSVRQLVDVALRALSPGVNDPTTALDAVVHLGSLLVDSLTDDPAPRAYELPDGQVVSLAHPLTDEELAELALGELARHAAGSPAVVVYLMELVESVREVAVLAGRGERADPLVEQARLLHRRALAEASTPDDVALVDDAYRTRFPDHPPLPAA